jgi:hypothetical protein
MTLHEWEDEKDRELDEQLTALFHSVQPPAPPAGFVSRTMHAVRRAPLVDGRSPLRRPWTVPFGWAALVTAAIAAMYGFLNNQPLAAEAVSSLVAFGVRVGMRLVQSVHTTSLVFELLATTSRVVSHAMSTREGTVGLMVMALVAATSLTMLNKLLFSGKESSSW